MSINSINKTNYNIIALIKDKNSVKAIKSLSHSAWKNPTGKWVKKAKASPKYKWAKKKHAGLESVKGLKNIEDGLKSIPVLLQGDASAEGLQACGLHALKNGLIAVFVQELGPQGAELFKDQGLYDHFYETYCKPVLDRFKEKDASIAVVREIYLSFIEDPHPHQSLQEIHKVLKSTQIPIVQFNITSGENEKLGFGTMGALEVFDAMRLYQFANEKGPRSIVCLFGDQAEGHWMTVIINKDVSGVFSFKCCDSMGDLNTTALIKLKAMCEEVFKNSEVFMKMAYSNLQESIDRWVGWIEEGSASRFVHLLNRTPNELLRDGMTDGSEKQRNIVHLLQSYYIIKNCNWFKKLDLNIQLSLYRLEKAMDFYLRRSNEKDPQYALLESALKDIQDNRVTNFVEQICDFEKEKLKAYQDSLPFVDKIPEAQFTRLIDMFDFIKLSYQSRTEIAQGSSKQDQINIANELYRKTFHREAGLEELSAGTSDQVQAGLEESAHAFLRNYQYLKVKDQLHELCARLTVPCFTGKLLAVNSFAAEIQFKIAEKSDKDIFETTKAIVAGCIIDCIADNIESDLVSEFIPSIDVNTFKKSEYQKDLISRFEMMSNSSQLESFVNFLQEREIWQEGDWNKIIPKLMEQSEFATLVAQGKQQALIDIT